MSPDDSMKKAGDLPQVTGRAYSCFPTPFAPLLWREFDAFLLQHRECRDALGFSTALTGNHDFVGTAIQGFHTLESQCCRR